MNWIRRRLWSCGAYSRAIAAITGTGLVAEKVLRLFTPRVLCDLPTRDTALLRTPPNRSPSDHYGVRALLP